MNYSKLNLIVVPVLRYAVGLRLCIEYLDKKSKKYPSRSFSAAAFFMPSTQ